MAEKKWLYYLLDEIGRSARIEGGIVQFKTTPKALVYTPTGWQDISIAWERNLLKHGVNRNFSLPLGFVLDGADILRNIGYKYNFEKKIYLLIQNQVLQIDENEFAFVYDYFYKGQIDWTTKEDSEYGYKVQIMEGGLVKDLNANQGTRYEIPIDDAESIRVRMDGVDLKLNSKFLVTNGFDPTNNNFSLRNHFVNLAEVALDNSISISAKPVERSQSIGDNANLIGNPNWFFKATTDCKLTLSYRFKVGAVVVPGGTLDPSGRTSINFQLVRNGAISSVESKNIFYGLLSSTGNIIQGNVTMNVKTGDFVYFRTFFTIIGATGDAIIEYTYYDPENSYLNLDALYKFPPSIIKALRPFTLFKRLVGKISGSESYAESNLLNQFQNLCVTCGNAIRGLVGSSIMITMNDFSQAFDSVLCTGTGIVKNKISIESRERYYLQSDPITLGNVSDPVQTEANEIMINTIRVGYEKQDISDANGKLSFHNTSIFSTPVKSVVKEYSILSPIKADPIAIEWLRASLDNKTSTDNTSDNDSFFINVDIDHPNDDGTYNLKRVQYSEFTSNEGDMTPTMFNVEDLSPGRMLKRHYPWLRGLLTKFEGHSLVLESADRNVIKTVSADITLDERIPIPIESMSGAYIKPSKFEFTALVSMGLPSIMEENPNRCFSFVHPRNGLTYKGYNLKIGIQPDSGEPQKYLLLSTYDNDLNTLSNVK